MDRVGRTEGIAVVAVKKWQREVKVGDQAKGPDYYTARVVQGSVLEANSGFVIIRRADTGDRASIRRKDLQGLVD
jgi:hypothetical protein